MTYEMDLGEDVTLSDEKRKIMLENSGYLQFKKELENFLFPFQEQLEIFL